MRRQLLVTALAGLLLTGCAVPTPQAAPGRAATLDPGAVLDDRVSFETTRTPPFTGEQACSLLKSLREYDDRSQECDFVLDKGESSTFAFEQSEFRYFWLGAVGRFYRGFRHSERFVLLGRYYGVELVDGNYTTHPCTVAVDLGGPQALTITVGAPLGATDEMAAGEEVPLSASLTYCAKARATAEALLTQLDPTGGSVTG